MFILSVSFLFNGYDSCFHLLHQGLIVVFKYTLIKKKKLLGRHFKRFDSKAECAVTVSKCRLKSAAPVLRNINILYYSLHPLYQIQTKF